MTATPRPNVEIQQLIDVIASVRRHAKLVWWSTLILGTIGSGALLLILALIADQFLVLPGMIRLLLLLAVLAAPVLLAARWLRNRPGDSPEELALLIERRYPDLDNMLINSLQLVERAPKGSESIVGAITHDAGDAVNRLRPTSAIPKRWLVVAAVATLLGLFYFAGRAATNPQGLNTGLTRVLIPLGNNSLTRILDITPGTADVLADSEIVITATLGGRIPTTAQLIARNAEGVTFNIPMSAASQATPDKLTGKIDRIAENLTYRVVAGDTESSTFELRVFHRPVVQSVAQLVTPPDYIRSKPQEATGGHVQAVIGSKVAIAFFTDQQIKDGRIVFEGGNHVPLKLDGAVSAPGSRTVMFRSSASLAVEKSTRYKLELVSEKGFENEPTSYDVVAMEHRPPTVEITAPASEVTVPIEARIVVDVRASDEFAVREVKLFKVETPGNGGSAPGAGELPAGAKVLASWTIPSQDQARVTQTQTLNAADLGLKADAPVTIQAAAFNYKPGSAAGVSAPVTIRLKHDSNEPAKSPQAGKISLAALIAKQRANADASDASMPDKSKPDARPDLSSLVKRQEEIRSDAQALSTAAVVDKDGKPQASGTANTVPPNPEMQKKLADLADTLMKLAVEQLRTASTATDRADPLTRAIFTQKAILKALVAADARQDEELSERTQREIAEALAELIARQQSVRKDTLPGDAAKPDAKAKPDSKPATPESAAALAARQSVLARDAAKLQKQMQAAANTGAGGNPELAKQFTDAAAAFDSKAIRKNMLIAAERLGSDTRSDAAKLQDQIIADLLEIQKVFRNAALAEAKKDIEEAKEGLKELKDNVDKLVELQKAIVEVSRELQKTKDLSEGRKDALDKLDEIKAAKKNVEDAIEQLVKDLHLLPDMSASNDLLSEANEIYEDVKQREGTASQTAAEEIAVTRDEGTLAALKAMQKKMGERIGDLEMWLSPGPDATKWKQESWDKNEIGKIPLGDLPDELEDIVGKLVDKTKELEKDAKDSASNVGIPDGVMGWDIADGPMPSWSAKGKSGNDKPNDMEQVGRSGSGRQGKSSGEIVGDTVKNLKGGDVEARRTNDGFQAGELKEEKGDAMDVKATGGGKLAGTSPNEGMTGDAPPRDELKYRDMERQSQQIKRDAETVYSKAKLLKLPTGELERAILELDAAQRRLRQGDVDGFAKSQAAVVRALKETQSRLDGKTVVDGGSSSARTETNSAGATGEPVPRQYEDTVAEYMRRIAGEGK